LTNADAMHINREKQLPSRVPADCLVYGSWNYCFAVAEDKQEVYLVIADRVMVKLQKRV